MRSGIIAMLLAVASGQQVCKLGNFVEYSDPDCKRETSTVSPEVK